MVGRLANEVASFVVFTALDLLDAVLCWAFKLVDYAFEAKWKPCYCSPSAREMIAGSGDILVSESGKPRVVFLSSTKLHLEEISDTLYARPPLLLDISRATMTDLRSLGFLRRNDGAAAAAAANAKRVRAAAGATALTINSAIVEMLQGKIGGKQSQPVPRWSDCACRRCSGWCSAPASSRALLHVHAQCPPGE